MNRIQLLCIVFYLLALNLNAQEIKAKDSLNKRIQTIINYDDYFTTRIALSNKFNSFTIKDRVSSVEYLVSPNQEINATFSIAYRFVEINIGYTPRFLRLNNDQDIKGESKFFNLGTRLYVGKFMQNVQYSRTVGFYVEDLDKELIPIEAVVFADLKVVKFGGSTSYIFNPKFSMRSAFKQNEWQTKSSGSFVPSLSYYWTKITGEDDQPVTFFDITIGPSYFYNWIIKDHFLVSAGAHAGMGYDQTKFTYSDAPSKKIDGIIFTTEFKLALGYNSTRFFTGTNVSIDSFYHNSEPDFRVDDHQNYFEFYLGYRFNAPRKVTEGTDYIEEKLNQMKKELLPN